MKFYESGAALAEDVGVLVSKMQDSIEANYQVLPNGGPYPAYPSGKSME